MKKLFRNTAGFGAIELILIIVVVGLLGFVGWYVYQARNTDKQTTNTSQSQNSQPKNTEETKDSIPGGFSKYEDEYVSFAYPSDWKVEKQYSFNDEYSAHLINLKAPVDASLKANGYQNLYFSGSILIAKNGRFDRNCREDCTVYAVNKISPKDPSTNSTLVISDWASQGRPQVIEYTRKATSVGQKQYELGFDIGNTHFTRVYGNYQSGDVSFVSLANVEAFQNSKAYKQLLQVIPTVVVNSQKLPQ